jgi:hypothetical protein
MKKVKYIILGLLGILFIIGFFFKYTLLSSVKNIELFRFWTPEIYVLKDNKKIIDDSISLDITIGSKLKTLVILPYILSYIKNSWEYSYWFDIFWKFYEINNVKIYILYDNRIVDNNIIDINKTLLANWDIRFWVNNKSIYINKLDSDNIKFVIEFDWKGNWGNNHYEIINTLKKKEENYFWNMFIYVLGRNF